MFLLLLLVIMMLMMKRGFNPLKTSLTLLTACRLYLISICKNLKVLDFKKVKQQVGCKEGSQTTFLKRSTAPHPRQGCICLQLIIVLFMACVCVC